MQFFSFPPQFCVKHTHDTHDTPFRERFESLAQHTIQLNNNQKKRTMIERFWTKSDFSVTHKMQCAIENVEQKRSEETHTRIDWHKRNRQQRHTITETTNRPTNHSDRQTCSPTYAHTALSARNGNFRKALTRNSIDYISYYYIECDGDYGDNCEWPVITRYIIHSALCVRKRRPWRHHCALKKYAFQFFVHSHSTFIRIPKCHVLQKNTILSK